VIGVQVDTFHEVFLVTGIICLLTVIPALLLGGRDGDTPT